MELVEELVKSEPAPEAEIHAEEPTVQTEAVDKTEPQVQTEPIQNPEPMEVPKRKAVKKRIPKTEPTQVPQVTVDAGFWTGLLDTHRSMAASRKAERYGSFALA